MNDRELESRIKDHMKKVTEHRAKSFKNISDEVEEAKNNLEMVRIFIFLLLFLLSFYIKQSDELVDTRTSDELLPPLALFMGLFVGGVKPPKVCRKTENSGKI